jgi:hypothetical protein
VKRARYLLAGMIVAGLALVAPSAEAGAKPATKPTATTTTTTTLPTVHPGAFCSPPGKKGRTTKGTRMKCAKASDKRYRWIKA